jgi:hypothetical protein
MWKQIRTPDGFVQAADGVHDVRSQLSGLFDNHGGVTYPK